MGLEQLGPILAGVAGGAAFYLLGQCGKRPATRRGGERYLRFTLPVRLLIVLLVGAIALIVYGAATAQTGARLRLLAGASIALLIAYAACFVFFVELSYDAQHLHYRTLFAGVRSIPWSQVECTGYSELLQCHFIQTTPIRRIWCSFMMEGFDELFDFIELARPPPSPGRD